MAKYVRIFAATLLSLFAAGPAHAAAARYGATIQAIVATVRGNVVAYDSVNHVYLVVSSHGVVYGRFVDASGNLLGAPFAIQGNPANFGHFPRAAFSPDAGAFLVTWHEGTPSVHARMVSYTQNGPIGADTQLTTDISWWEAGAPVAYSTASHEFLVAWRRVAANPAPNDIRAVRVSNSATPLGPVFNITNDPDYQDNPSVAYNASSNEFLVVYAGYNDPGGYAYVDAQRVQAGSGALLGGPTRLTVTGGTYITDVTYNASTGKYLAAWYSLPTAAALGRVLNADGSIATGVLTLSTRWKAYDALSVAYNTRSNTFFMVSHSSTAEDGGVEIDTNGNPMDNGFIVTAAGGNGNYYPRVGASTDAPNWLLSTANNFTSTMVQMITGSAGGGGGTPPVTQSPPPQPPQPLMNLDYPVNLASVASNGFQVAGWAIDKGATSGTGIDALHVYAWPTNGGAPTFLGAATYGIARPDVGAYFGAAFTNSGFSLVASGLPPGTYDIVANAHSAISGNWDARLKRVTVTAPVSIPRMWVDLPAQNQNTSQNLVIAGWAVDLASTQSSGVDAIHCYAYPAGSNSAIWLGAAAVNLSRSDVGNAFGAARFAASGFLLNTTLGPGAYTLVVFAHSSITNTFNNAQTVNIIVR